MRINGRRIIKKKNKDGSEFDSPNLRNFTEEQKEGIRAAVPLWGGKEKAIQFFLNVGYERDILEQVLKILIERKSGSFQGGLGESRGRRRSSVI